MLQKRAKSDRLSPFASEVSTQLLTADRGELPMVLTAVAADIGEHFDVDRVELHWTENASSFTADNCVWARKGELPGSDCLLDAPSWIHDEAARGRTVTVSAIDSVPSAAARDFLRARDSQALLATPMEFGGRLLGVLVLLKHKASQWDAALAANIDILAKLIATFANSAARPGAIDANDRHRAGRALRESEMRFRDIVENTADTIWETDLDLNITYTNKPVDRHVDRTVQGSKQNLVDRALHPDDLRRFREDLPGFIARKVGWQRRVHRIRDRNGSYRYIESTATPMFDEWGEICGFRGVDRDVSGEYYAADEIQSYEAMTCALLESVNDAVFTTDNETIIDCNPVALNMFGATREMVIGKSPWEISPEYQPDGSNSKAKASELLRAARRGEPQRFEWVHRANDGTEIYADISLTRIETRNGIRVIGIIRDTSEISRRAAFQSRLAKITAAFLDVDTADTDSAIEEALAVIGEDYGIDVINLTWFDGEQAGFRQHISWSRAALADFETDLRLKPGITPWSTASVLRGEPAIVDSVDELPENASVDQASFRRLGYKSILCLPLLLRGTTAGAVAFFLREQRVWDEAVMEELMLLRSALSTAFVRQRSAAALKAREMDLSRSQSVAGVGSARVFVRAGDNGKVGDSRIEYSDQALQIFELRKGESSPFPLLDKVDPRDRFRLLRAWRASVGKQSAPEVEFRIRKKDGTIATIQFQSSVDSIDEDGTISTFGTFKDVSEWVEANRRLQTAMSEIESLKDRLQEENLFLRGEIRAAHGFDSIIGETPALRAVLASLERVAPTDVTVLVTGETGTGKELIARSIHDLSHRKYMPMISVNCAALAHEIVESELFGHEKGAFTGAFARRKGRFELADGGTLFLDEIGDISGELQAKLLRAIQEGEFERLGGSTTLKTDARLVVATNRDLRAAVDAGEFRADLYYRIASFPVHMPPLRERVDDIPLLAEHFVKKHAEILGKEISSISARTIRYLMHQDWPGNVRELEGSILRALISTRGPVLDYAGDVRSPRALPITAAAGSSSLDNAQRDHIRDVLKQTNGVIGGKHGAATVLGLAPSTLRSKMKRLDIERPAQVP